MKYNIEKNTGDHSKPFKNVELRVVSPEGCENMHVEIISYGCDACNTPQKATRAQLAQMHCIQMEQFFTL